MPELYPALGFAFCQWEGGMHDHMTLHAHFYPLVSHSRPSNASEHSGGCRSLLQQGKDWRLPWCSALYSVLRK